MCAWTKDWINIGKLTRYYVHATWLYWVYSVATGVVILPIWASLVAPQFAMATTCTNGNKIGIMIVRSRLSVHGYKQLPTMPRTHWKFSSSPTVPNLSEDQYTSNLFISVTSLWAPLLLKSPFVQAHIKDSIKARWPVDSPRQRPGTRKMFPFGDNIM